MWIGVVVLVALVIAFAFKKASPKHSSDNTFNTVPINSVPCPPSYDPALGNLPDLAKAGSLHEYLTLLHNQYFDKFVLSLASPELFKQTNKLFNRPVPLFELFRPLIGDLSLQYANDEDAKKRRRLLDPVFSHSSIKNVFPVFIEASQKCVSKWLSEMHDDGPIQINLHNEMFNIAIYAIALSAFGSKMPEEEMKVLRESYDHCWGEMEESIKGTPIQPGSAREAMFLKNRDVMFDLVQRMLDTRKPAAEENEEGHGRMNKGVGGFVEFILQQESFSHEQIKCHTITFLIGGFHTTANFWIWTLYFLAKHPEHQHKVREEMKEVLKGGQPSFEAVCGMPFTTAVLNETLRGRYSNENEKIGDITVPKGTMMVQALGVVLQSEEHWKRADEFSPERFITNEENATSQWAFRPFGVGSRMCPASKYAMLEAKAVLATLVPKFKFELLAGKQNVKAEYGLVGQMSEGCHLQVSPIN